jgi:maltose alpha-D-glucosyltransferase/alpha-amylase
MQELIDQLEERRAKTSPLRDVAGFLRSLDYAAAAVERPSTDASPQPVRERRAALLERFRRDTARAFLENYWSAVAAAPELGLSPEREGLLDLMLLQKASYEIAYEAANRPQWLTIPLRGFAVIVDLGVIIGLEVKRLPSSCPSPRAALRYPLSKAREIDHLRENASDAH